MSRVVFYPGLFLFDPGFFMTLCVGPQLHLFPQVCCFRALWTGALERQMREGLGIHCAQGDLNASEMHGG